MTEEPDFIVAKEKIRDATNWRGSVNISLGDTTVTFAHRLLTESEITQLQQTLDLSAAQEANENLGATEAQERLLELQQKEEELTEEEEEELDELSRQVAGETEQIEEAFGEDGYELLMEMGRRAVKPTEEDIEYVYNSSPSEMKRHLGIDGKLPNPLTKEVVEEYLQEEIADMITDQPFPIKLNIGIQAFSETISVLGNGRQQ